MKSRCICVLLVGTLFPLQAIGQKITVQTIKSPQVFAPMQGRTGEIVQSLPGERVIDKETVNGKTSLYYLDKEGKRTKIYEGGAVEHFTRSRTGERICFHAQGKFIVKDLATLQEFRFEELAPLYLKGFANISPDGDKVVFGKSPTRRSVNQSDNDNLITVRDLMTEEEQVIGKGADPKWSTVSQQIVFSIADGHVGDWTPYLWVMNSDGTGARKLKSSIYMDGWYVTWSPDGKYVMDSDRRGNLRIVDVAKDKAVVVPPSDLGEVPNCRKSFFSTEWSPDSKTILVHVLVEREITEEIAGWELYSVSVDGGKIEKLEVPRLAMETPLWLNNEKLLYRNSQAGDGWNEAAVRRAEQ